MGLFKRVNSIGLTSTVLRQILQEVTKGLFKIIIRLKDLLAYIDAYVRRTFIKYQC